MRVVRKAMGFRSRNGMALPLLLVLLLALTLLGHGTLLLARREVLASRAFLHGVQADLAAGGAVSRVMAGLPTLPGPRTPGGVIPLLSGWADEDLWQEVSFRWLSSELFLMEGKGRRKGWSGVRVKGALGWALDPATRIGALRAGLELGGGFFPSPGTEASAVDLLGLPTGWDPEDCAGYATALDSVFAGGALPLTAALPSRDSMAVGGVSQIPSLGFLSGASLLELTREVGFLESGVTSVPTDSGCPDSDPPVLMGSVSDLEIRDRWVCGLLVVEGDLRIEGSGGVQGLALVGGNFFLAGSGTLEGLARVRGSVHAEESANIRISACPAIRALAGNPTLLKPLLLPGASGFPIY
jgi:hypothetical protein